MGETYALEVGERAEEVKKGGAGDRELVGAAGKDAPLELVGDHGHQLLHGRRRRPRSGDKFGWALFLDAFPFLFLAPPKKRFFFLNY